MVAKKGVGPLRLNAESKRIFLNALRDAIGLQIKDPWERGMYRQLMNRTVLVPVKSSVIARTGDKIVKGENVSRVIVMPGRGKAYIGDVRIFIPEATLAKASKISSRDPAEQMEAIQAMHDIAHEFGHNAFKAIDYENRLTRYYYFNEKPLERVISMFLENTGKFAKKEAKEKAKKLVQQNPLFWANYAAHTIHEAGADMIAGWAVSQLTRGRPPTKKELMYATMYRPATVREILRRMPEGGSAGLRKKPPKPSRLEELASRIERFSGVVVDGISGSGRFINPLEAAPVRVRAKEGRKAYRAV